MPTLIFQETDDPVSSQDFARYVYLLRAAYAHSLRITPSDENEVLNLQSKYIDSFKARFALENPDVAVEELFSTELGELELKFVTINKSSPLVITCVCVVSALTLAVIVSGGKVDVDWKGKVKFTLPPLGTGIKSLLEAFGKSQRKK